MVQDISKSEKSHKYNEIALLTIPGNRDKLSENGMTGLLGCFLLLCGFGAMAAIETVGECSKPSHMLSKHF